MAADGVIYAPRLARRDSRGLRGWKVNGQNRWVSEEEEEEEEEEKGGRGQVVGEKNIHAWGDAEFSFSRR